MSILDVAQDYFDAWNAHDGKAVLDTFTPLGTYEDPTTRPISGESIVKMVNALAEMYENLHFETKSKAQASENMVAAEWIMKGKIQGVDTALEGSDFIRFENGKIHSVKGYFDSVGVARQLGMQVISQPTQMGPVTMGTSIRMTTGKSREPKSLSLTYIAPKEGEGAEYNDRMSGVISNELMGMEGFPGASFLMSGERAYTITLWDTEDGPVRKLLHDGSHKDAVSHFFKTDVAKHGMTSVWTPQRIKYFVVCDNCQKNEDYYRNNGQSNCGVELPKPELFF